MSKTKELKKLLDDFCIDHGDFYDDYIKRGINYSEYIEETEKLKKELVKEVK